MSYSKHKLIINSANNILFSPRLKKKFNSVFSKTKSIDRNIDFVIWDSNKVLFPSLLSKKVAVYTGNFFSFFQVRTSMLFHRAGLFVRTKRLGSVIHVSKRKKKK